MKCECQILKRPWPDDCKFTNQLRKRSRLKWRKRSMLLRPLRTPLNNFVLIIRKWLPSSTMSERWCHSWRSNYLNKKHRWMSSLPARTRCEIRFHCSKLTSRSSRSEGTLQQQRFVAWLRGSASWAHVTDHWWMPMSSTMISNLSATRLLPSSSRMLTATECCENSNAWWAGCRQKSRSYTRRWSICSSWLRRSRFQVSSITDRGCDQSHHWSRVKGQ